MPLATSEIEQPEPINSDYRAGLRSTPAGR
jgi:hypothetical protein